MKKSYLALGAALLLCSPFQGMAKGDEGYKFKTIVSQKVTPVKNQASTGTCWCFATTSFFEAELLRMGKGEYDLSEMFIVRQKYMNQLADNFLRRGRGNIGEGSITSSWITAFNQVGIVPEEVYTGINYNSDRHNHSELTDYIEAIGDMAVKRRSESEQYKQLVNSLFDIYLGKLPEKFTYKGKEYTPHSFFESTGLNPNDYISLTSYTHHPFYEPFVLEIQDNWRWGQSYNLPIDEFMQVFDNAINNGYPIAWGSDVSEQGFTRDGVAVMPDTEKVQELSGSDMAHWLKMKPEEKKLNTKPQPQKWCTQEERQEAYDNWETTDDHGMLIYGIAKDQEGNDYYMVKNSWGKAGKYDGLWYASKAFVRYKTMNIVVNKNALPKEIAKKLGIK